MSEWLKTLFVSIFGTHSGLATFIISMIPIVELRGAIPFGSASSFWGENALSLWQSFGYSVAGSSLVCVILTFIFLPIFNWLKSTKGFKKFAEKIENKLKRNSKNIDDKVSEAKTQKKVLLAKIVGVFCFVALPLPLTGVWTGTCLALFIGLNKFQTMGTVISGNLIAGLLMMLISYFFADNTIIVLYAFLILVLIFILFEVVKSIIRKSKQKKMENNQNKNALALETSVETSANGESGAVTETSDNHENSDVKN